MKILSCVCFISENFDEFDEPKRACTSVVSITELKQTNSICRLLEHKFHRTELGVEFHRDAKFSISIQVQILIRVN